MVRKDLNSIEFAPIINLSQEKNLQRFDIFMNASPSLPKATIKPPLNEKSNATTDILLRNAGRFFLSI